MPNGIPLPVKANAEVASSSSAFGTFSPSPSPTRPPAGFTPKTSAAASQPPKDFTPSDPSLVRVGIKVEHPRFGVGSVIALEGADSNVKATVEFPIGKKQLLLKFAKLRVVE